MDDPAHGLFADRLARTAPAPLAGSGLEVDKLNARHVEAYFHGYMDPIEKALGPLLGKSLRYVMMDSWEAGMQNWTDDMIAQFQKRRGYDPRPYLPVLAGRVVGSADLSDRFLWDFRRTHRRPDRGSPLRHDGGLAQAEGNGHLRGGRGRLHGDPGRHAADQEQGGDPDGRVLARPDASAAGILCGRAHGALRRRMCMERRFVAAESFTGGGYDAPATYKNLGDYWFAQGVNRIVFHSSAHQPLDTKPGNTMVGTHFNRNITWAEQARPVMTYLARTSYMLQQGLFVADFAYLLNEGAPSSQPFWGAGLQPAAAGRIRLRLRSTRMCC